MRTGFYLLAAAAFICSVALLLVRYRQLQQEAAWDAGLAAERSRGGSDGGSPVEDAADVALKGVPCPDPNLYPPSHKSTGAASVWVSDISPAAGWRRFASTAGEMPP
jgi:hypothetical protein